MDDSPPPLKKKTYYYTSGKQYFHASLLYCKLVKPSCDVVGVAIADREPLQVERLKLILPCINVARLPSCTGTPLFFGNGSFI